MTNPFFLNQVLLKFASDFKKQRTDISAVRFTSDRHLWVGSDEGATIERLSFIDAQSFDEHKQFHVLDFIDLPEPEDQEIDIEGFAYFDNYLWFIGSHSWKRKKPKPQHNDIENIARLAKIKTEANRYILGRIPLVKGELFKTCQHPESRARQLTAAKLQMTKRGNVLMDALAEDPHLGYFVDATIPGKDNGFDIEGIAIYQNKVFLGLRGPVLRGWAMMLQIQLEEDNSDVLKLKQIGDNGQLYKKHFVYLNGLGIRDLCLDGEDLLFLAGPTMDLDGPVRLYRLAKGVHLSDDVLSKPEMVMEIAYGDGDDHPEGITLFTEVTETPSILVVYDAPAAQRLKGEADVLADVLRLS